MSERHKPLFFHWDHRPYHSAIEQHFNCSQAGAASLLAIYAADGTVSYSRNSNHYNLPSRYRRKLFTYTKVTGAIDQLSRDGFLNDNRVPPLNFGLQSSVTMPDLTRHEITHLTDGRLFPSPIPEPIILRDENKWPRDYRETKETRRMRSALLDLNEALQAAELTGCLACPLYRVFNLSFERGGRFYSNGGWQSLPKGERQKITINGERAVEIDYKAMHACLIYGKAGLPMPSDCYEIEPWPRELVKVAFLIMVNARDANSARAAIAQNDRMSLLTMPNSSLAHQKAKDLVQAIETRHHRIARAFYSDSGAALMRIDSDIAEHVQTSLNHKGIVALPVHDSFLVSRTNGPQLEEAMLRAAFVAGFPDLRVQW